MHLAEQFLRTLDPAAPGFTFQTFAESKAAKANGKARGRILHGTHAEQAEALALANQGGAGVFVMVNAGDGAGRKAENVKRVRALFLDLDEGGPTKLKQLLEECLGADAIPHAVVQTSPGKFHVYWRITGCPLGRFSILQTALAKRFGGDLSVKDLPRVMRLPGYQHHKSEPRTSQLMHCSKADAYSVDELASTLGLDAQQMGNKPPEESQQTAKEKTSAQPLREGERNTGLFKLARRLRNDGTDYDTAKAQVLAEAARCEPPYPETEAVATVDSAYSRLVLDPRKPLPIADAFIESRHANDGHPTLIYDRQDWLLYDGAAYRAIESVVIEKGLYEFLEGVDKPTRNGGCAPFDPGRRHVEEIMHALRSRTYRPISEIGKPGWLDNRNGPPPSELVACRNGLLHLPTGRLDANTPLFFTRNALEFDFDQFAPAPVQWLQFLAQLWPDDPEQIALLQEVMGYLLTADTSQQKIFLLVGPKRAGKGTIGRVIERLVGQRNVIAPTLSSLAGEFGLQPLIGKPVALVSDAQIGRRVETSVIGENLKRISGEDTITVNRKNKEMWTGRLPTRFVMMANELPRLNDVSGALASRFIVLKLRVSFYGKEDHALDRKLAAELPGILNWAIEGWRRLSQRGRFAEPEASKAVAEELANIGSPVQKFIGERCELGAHKSADAATLYNEYTLWCRAEGWQSPLVQSEFGRQLQAAAPEVEKHRPRSGTARKYQYTGIAPRNES